MDLTEQNEQIFSKREQKFKNRIEKVLLQQDLTQHKQLIEKITQDLNISLTDCAAALVFLSQGNLYHPSKKQPETKALSSTGRVFLQPVQPPKMVRYRIEVGQKHNVTSDDIKNVFIEEAGVDKKNIGEVDIRYHYSLIELPEGMPSDIYQLLTTVCLCGQKLNIKRLKPYREHSSHHHQRKNKGSPF